MVMPDGGRTAFGKMYGLSSRFFLSSPPPPPVPLFTLSPCVRATSPWLSLSPAKRKRKRLLPMHTIPIRWGNFKTEVFTLKTYQMFYVHTTPQEFKNATITGNFGFVFEENSVTKTTWLSWSQCFRKDSFSVKMFSVRCSLVSGLRSSSRTDNRAFTKTQIQRLHSHLVEERLLKARFPWLETKLRFRIPLAQCGRCQKHWGLKVFLNISAMLIETKPFPL